MKKEISHFNLRVFKNKDGPYSVRTAYYEKLSDSIPHSWAADSYPTKMAGHSLDDLKGLSNQVARAFDKKTLYDQECCICGQSMVSEDEQINPTCCEDE